VPINKLPPLASFAQQIIHYYLFDILKDPKKLSQEQIFNLCLCFLSTSSSNVPELINKQTNKEKNYKKRY